MLAVGAEAGIARPRDAAARTPSSVRAMRRAGVWIAIAGGVLAGGLALDAGGLPSSYLFAALLLGLAIALARPDRVALPPVAFRGAQAVAGVSLGAYLQEDALRAVADSVVPVLAVSAATLGLSLAAGAILTRTTPLDPPTALLGMIAGGASGIVGMSAEIGGDDRRPRALRGEGAQELGVGVGPLAVVPAPVQEHQQRPALPAAGRDRGHLRQRAVREARAQLVAAHRHAGLAVFGGSRAGERHRPGDDGRDRDEREADPHRGAVSRLA